jgi:hypothetical protein
MPDPPPLAPIVPEKRGGIGGSIELLWKKSNYVCTRNVLCDRDQARALCAIWNNPTIETAKQHEMTGHHAMEKKKKTLARKTEKWPCREAPVID